MCHKGGRQTLTIFARGQRKATCGLLASSLDQAVRRPSMFALVAPTILGIWLDPSNHNSNFVHLGSCGVDLLHNLRARGHGIRDLLLAELPHRDGGSDDSS
ncbi:hypothetical protein VFPFJ_04203 [Purpureocillium lilacinum]|uniref:Uncharacterized protein n=1 Tax=Purpureocillium lilacinum TaxID=33203 RepID=A0A179HSY0_PURLI|nr:hypothetical protein VFPFJ_04203 [Purpureocillium lilacinum]OAQ92463.1 hypothetical protein VFPFJ_04203 [Purpureocillium lilacinum]